MTESEVRPDDFAFVYLDVSFPPVAWLAYRGTLNSCAITSANPGNISWFLVETIKRGLISTLRREGTLEGFRVKSFNTHTSRLRCVYAYPTLDDAKKGNESRGKFISENLVAIAPACANFKSEEHDSTWITNFDSLPIDTAKRYWEGELTKEPLRELLLDGRFLILGTSVRKKSYETIKKACSTALALLELSRLAAHFGSDLGAVAPWLKQDGDRIVVTHIMNYSGKEGVEIFKKAIEEHKKDRSFAVNWDDLKPLCAKREDPQLDALFSAPDFRSYDHELRVEKVNERNEFVATILAHQ